MTREQMATEVLDRRIQEIQNAWGRSGLGEPHADTARQLLDLGWTRQRVEQIHRLADHARRVRAAVARPSGPGDVADDWEVRARLVRSAEVAVDNGATYGDAVAWLAVRCAEAEPGRERWLRHGFRWIQTTGGRIGTPASETRPTEMATWSRTVGPLAALAWAAGMTLPEAQMARAAGTLNASGLKTLAGLRGYRLPTMENFEGAHPIETGA